VCVSAVSWRRMELPVLIMRWSTTLRIETNSISLKLGAATERLKRAPYFIITEHEFRPNVTI
jgi:hypothetical protein